MSFMINPSAWGGIFPVPVDIVDKHIRLAGAVQLKVLLWVLRHSADSTGFEQIVDDLKISKVDAEDALQYWIDAKIITNDNSPVNNVEEEKQEKIEVVKAEPEKIKKEIEYTKPNMAQIIARTNESPEIKFMFSEVQNMLSKTIGHDGQSTLLMLHDSFGLPVEVILMLVGYCVSIGKSAFVYISKVGRDWGEKEIDTIEKADEQISYLRSTNKIWTEIKRLTGISTSNPTEKQMKLINSWTNDLKFDVEMIYLAYEEMANNCSRISWDYINKVLINWHNDSIKTPQDFENAKKQRKESFKKKESKEKTDASYDIDEFTKRALGSPIVYKKKEEN